MTSTNIASLKDKLCIVTGANSGIGFAVAEGLLRRGAKLILPVRNMAKAQSAKQLLINKTQNPNIEIISCDLSLKSSVRAFVQKITLENIRIDILCHCAGHTYFERSLTSEGIENNFATNVLGPYHLTKLLLPLFNPNIPSHVINIAGEFHRFFKIDFNDIFYANKFSALRVGSISMLERITLSHLLANELKETKILVNCFHPGNIHTEMTQKMPFPLKQLSVFLRPFQNSPDHGADTALWLAEQTYPSQAPRGQYFINRKSVPSAAASYDSKIQEKLKHICEELLKD